VYDAVKKFLEKALVDGRVPDRDFDAFLNDIHGSEFLFDGDTVTYIDNILNLAIDAKNARLRPSHDPPYKPSPEEEKLGRFATEQYKSLEAVFRRYLDLSEAGLKRRWPWG
jgi:hypothetical protein